MGRPGWRKRAQARLASPAETAAAGLLLLFLSRAGVKLPSLAPSPISEKPETPAQPRAVRDLGEAEVVE